MDDRYGPIIAGQVLPDHFDVQYRAAAAGILAYHRRYRKAPGEAQLLSVVAAGRDGDRAAGARRLVSRLVAMAATLNAAYATARTAEFVKQQTLTAAVAEATERLLSGGEDNLVEDVEGILRTALNQQRTPMEAGTFLSDTRRGLEFLNRAKEGYRLGIGPLDEAGIGLTPKEMLLYVAPKNSGKSWFCVHCGRQALTQGAKVVHLTLEMEDTIAIGRYHQSMFGAGWKDEKFTYAELEFDDLDRLSGFRQRQRRPKISFSAPGAKKWLRERINQWGTRLGRLVVREFPSGTLTIPALRGYLDYLDAAHKFVPHVLIVDYPDLMALDRRNFRLDLGRLYVELRGLAQERNLALVAPTQGNRESLGASKVSAGMTSEDISKVFTADTVLTYSRTAAEERLGLARLHVDYARTAARGQTILLAQSYATGQYALQSALMRKVYWDRLDEVQGKGGDDE